MEKLIIVDMIFIDYGSYDKTKEICVNNGIPHISLVHNLGIGGAVQTGYKYALDNSQKKYNKFPVFLNKSLYLELECNNL